MKFINYSIFAIALLSFDATAADNEAISKGTETVRINHVFSDKSHQLFQERKPTIVKNLAIQCRAYAERNTTMNRAELRAIIKEAAEGRASIAQDAGSPDADEFKTFRLESDTEYEVTDLCNHLYDHMRSSVLARIRGLLTNKTEGTWIVGDDGRTRYRMRVQNMEQWPVLLNGDLLFCYLQKFHQQTPVNQTERSFVDTVLHFYYAKEFFSGGCYVIGPTGGMINYQKSVAPQLLSSLLTQLSTYDRLQPKPLNDPINYFNFTQDEESNVTVKVQEIDSKYTVTVLDSMKQIKFPQPYNINNSKFIWIDIEHRINNGHYYPGYGFIGFMPADKVEGTSDIPLMLYHPAHVYLPFFVEQYENALHTALTTNCEDVNQAIDVVGRYQYRWTRAMPTLRGSAAIGEFEAEAIYDHLGYTDVTFDPKIFFCADQAGFMYWSEEEFLTKYRQAIKIKPKGATLQKLVTS